MEFMPMAEIWTVPAAPMERFLETLRAVEEAIPLLLMKKRVVEALSTISNSLLEAAP